MTAIPQPSHVSVGPQSVTFAHRTAEAAGNHAGQFGRLGDSASLQGNAVTVRYDSGATAALIMAHSGLGDAAQEAVRPLLDQAIAHFSARQIPELVPHAQQGRHAERHGEAQRFGTARPSDARQV